MLRGIGKAIGVADSLGNIEQKVAWHRKSMLGLVIAHKLRTCLQIILWFTSHTYGLGLAKLVTVETLDG